MSIYAALYEHLTADSDVTAEVSTRIYPLTAPTSATMPYVVIQLISTEQLHHFGAAGGIVKSVMQIDVWGETPEDVRDAALDIRESLDGLNQTSMGATEQLDVRGVSLQTQRTGHSPPSDGTETGPMRWSMDFEIWHAESVPTFA